MYYQLKTINSQDMIFELRMQDLESITALYQYAIISLKLHSIKILEFIDFHGKEYSREVALYEYKDKLVEEHFFTNLKGIVDLMELFHPKFYWGLDYGSTNKSS